MLKIGKGLHKKKKSKKNKHKDEELFTEEELEQYRKEHTQKATAEGAEATEDVQKTTSEELEKFKALTAGVDDILRKSQGDLDRIKKESFFQKKPTPSELKAQEEKEREELKLTQGNWIAFEERDQAASGKTEVEEEAATQDTKEDTESECELDDGNDVFDTAYVDALESGEVKLVYVPEDDDEEEDIVRAGEPDPFDTTSAEQVLKQVQQAEEKKKRQVSLGLAVQVLTGRADRDKSILEETGASGLLDEPVVANKPKKRPRKIQDFVLIGSFDEENNNQELSCNNSTATVVQKTLLDDDLNVDCELPEGDVLLTEVLAKQAPPKKEESFPYNNNGNNSSNNLEGKGSHQLQEVLSEFDAINEGVTPEVRKAEEVEDQFDEFTALAVSSVANQKLEEELQKYEDLEDDPFDTSTVNFVLKQEVDPFGHIDSKVPPPQIDQLSSNQKWSAFENDTDKAEVEADPFDTTFAEKLQLGKCELKLLESEILGCEVASAHRSDVHQEARILSRNNSESEFNPRAEKPVSSSSSSRVFRSKVSIQITDPSGVVETQRGSESEDLDNLNFRHRDLLGGSTTDLTKLGNEPLPPEVESPLEDFSKYSDPFDTSIVDRVAAPGKAELLYIEKELLSDIPKITEEDSLSDQDFDPREKENSAEKKVSFDVPSPGTELSQAHEGVRPLTPYSSDLRGSESDTCDFDDPFDTSHLTSSCLPGKEELKLIERELNSLEIAESVVEPVHKKLGLDETVCTGLKHSISDQDFNPREDPDQENRKSESLKDNRRFSDFGASPRNVPSTLNFQPPKPDLLVVEEEHSVKALTPAVEEDISAYVDPFDTSIADNIAPGKAELKVLENELITSASDGEPEIKRSYTDPDFNPRDDLRKTSEKPKSDILTFSEASTVCDKPLTPVGPENENEEEFDPFDTSIATNLVPGKAEIRVLESELFGQ